MQWLFLIAIGFICVVYPILLFISMLFLPFYMPIIFVVWLAICLLTIAYSKSEKVFEKLTVSIISSVVFSLILLGHIGMLDFSSDEKGAAAAIVMAPLFSLPAVYWLGNKLQNKIRLKQTADVTKIKENCKYILNHTISYKIVAQNLIERFQTNSQHSLKLISIVEDVCLTNEYNIKTMFVQKENERYAEYYKTISNKIPETEKQDFPTEYTSVTDYVFKLKNDIKELREILRNINKHDLKQLKVLEDRLKKIYVVTKEVQK